MGRSFIIGADVGDLNTRVKNSVISAINIWQNIEQVKWTRYRFRMLEHYDDIVLILDSIFQLSGIL